jgi:hypothetical protein
MRLAPAFVFLASLSILPGLVSAQARGGGVNLLERINRMSPAERKRLLDRMPPERRRQMEQRIANLEAISPEQRERVKKDLRFLEQLPPEKQDAARKLFREINTLPPERRTPVRGAINHLRKLPAAEQAEKLDSRVFRRRFSEDERKLIREAVTTLPVQNEPAETQVP